MNINEDKTVTLDSDEEMYIVIPIPKKTAELDIKVSFIINGEIVTMLQKCDSENIREYRDMYLTLDPTDDAFDIYALTPEYQEYLNTYGDHPNITFKDFINIYKEEQK